MLDYLGWFTRKNNISYSGLVWNNYVKFSFSETIKLHIWNNKKFYQNFTEKYIFNSICEICSSSGMFSF